MALNQGFLSFKKEFWLNSLSPSPGLDLGRRVRVLIAFAIGLTLSGCLQTRNSAKEIEEKQVLRKQVTNLQQTTAEVNAKFNEIDEDLRKMFGRIEQVDSRVAGLKEGAEKSGQTLESRVKELEANTVLIREELGRLSKDVTKELLETKAMVQSALQLVQGGSGSATGAVDKKDPFRYAEAKFEAKSYREAIFAYEEYRKAFPKGKNVTQATYKIGVSFQELGLNEDAKLFFEEVIAKAPKSKEAGLSRNRLKAIAKGNKRSPSGTDDPE